MDKPKNKPIKKQPNTFTKSVPKGYVIKRYLKDTSLTKNLDIAPRPPPNPISKIFIMYQL